MSRRVVLAGGALVAAAMFGAADQYLGALYSPSLTAVSGMSAPWLLLPFVAGACQPGRGRAALLGLAVTWVAVGGYVLMIVSPVEGVHLTVRAVAVTAASQWPWFLGGLVSGPVYGLLGYLCRTRRSWPVALLATGPIVLEPAVRWLAGKAGLISWPAYSPAACAEILTGLALTAVAALTLARTRARPRNLEGP